MFRITSVHVENFRGTRNLESWLHARTAVLSGRNAAVKTMVVDSPCVALGAIGSRVPGAKGWDLGLPGDVLSRLPDKIDYRIRIIQGRDGGRVVSAETGMAASHPALNLPAPGTSPAGANDGA